MIKGYESVAGQPAWRAMRHMELHPSDAVLPDGTIMSGNRFSENIVVLAQPRGGLRGGPELSPSTTTRSTQPHLAWRGAAAHRPESAGRQRVGRVAGRSAWIATRWSPTRCFVDADEGRLPAPARLARLQARLPADPR